MPLHNCAPHSLPGSGEFIDYYENQHSRLSARMGRSPSIPNAVRYVRRYLTPERNPIEAGLGWAVKEATEPIGYEAVAKARAEATVAAMQALGGYNGGKMLFLGFGIFTRPNLTIVIALSLGALSVSGALFLILELNNPYSGLLQIRDTPLRNALVQLGR